MWAHYITILEGPLLPCLTYKLRFHYPKQSHTTLQYAKNDATVVPVNDTRTQCTTTHVQGDLEVAMAIIKDWKSSMLGVGARLDNTKKRVQNQTTSIVLEVEGASSMGSVQVVQSNQPNKKKG